MAGSSVPARRDVGWRRRQFRFAENATKVELCRDRAAFAPLAAVIDPAFTWGDDRPPRMPWHKTVIYELHVKGFTQRN
jgi:glycogen operon protein